MSDISIPQIDGRSADSNRVRLARALLAKLSWRFRCHKCGKPAQYDARSAAYAADCAGPLCAAHFETAAEPRHVRF